MASAEERLMEWLRDAHAAEEQAETMLRGMAGRIENYPDLRARIEQHIGETQRQAKLVRGCIERRGGGTSDQGVRWEDAWLRPGHERDVRR